MKLISTQLYLRCTTGYCASSINPTSLIAHTLYLSRQVGRWPQASKPTSAKTSKTLDFDIASDELISHARPCRVKSIFTLVLNSAHDQRTRYFKVQSMAPSLCPVDQRLSRQMSNCSALKGVRPEAWPQIEAPCMQKTAPKPMTTTRTMS